ncbi:MAG: hypothetical protein AAFY60_05505 [Myxococcota bacterium]
MRYVLCIPLLCLAALVLVPETAHAQYKNSEFGLDIGPWLLTKPSILDDNNEPLPLSDRPLRFDYGVRIGGESSFKMNSDHWWFNVRLGVGVFDFGGDANGDAEDQFDALAADTLGTILGIEGQMGVRYVIATDRVRPYVQLSLSYMRLFSFAGQAGDTCADNLFCQGGTVTNEDAFLPTNNVSALHVQPGLELILQRDIALHVYIDVQRWVRFNGPDNWAPVFGVGVNFFS